MRALLISTYDMGRQPFGLASAAAAVKAGGLDVTCADLSRERLRQQAVLDAGLIGFFLPMHTASRLAIPVIKRIRDLNPTAVLCAFGLYAPLNEALLHDLGVAHVLGAEFEDDLRGLCTPALAGVPIDARTPPAASTVPAFQARGLPLKPIVPRVDFRVPDRTALPALSRYVKLRVGNELRIAGSTEASRGCKHRCRHCPIVPVYDGRFRVVPLDIVMADIRAQVADGARHITFGDPDFFNGIRHADAVVRTFAAAFPDVSYDVTLKIEHLLAHAGMLPVLRDTGCAFVTSAVESIDDEILRRLEKGHTHEDFVEAVRSCDEARLVLSPTFVAFSPWTTMEGYCALLQEIDRLGLVEHVAPIQLAIRLLVTEGSRLLELPEVRDLVRPFDSVTMTYPWRHPDPRADRLQEAVATLVGVRATAPRNDTFARIWSLAHEAAGLTPPGRETPLQARADIPYLDEPWYC